MLFQTWVTTLPRLKSSLRGIVRHNFHASYLHLCLNNQAWVLGFRSISIKEHLDETLSALDFSSNFSDENPETGFRSSVFFITIKKYLNVFWRSDKFYPTENEEIWFPRITRVQIKRNSTEHHCRSLGKGSWVYGNVGKKRVLITTAVQRIYQEKTNKCLRYNPKIKHNEFNHKSSSFLCFFTLLLLYLGVLVLVGWRTVPSNPISNPTH